MFKLMLVLFILLQILDWLLTRRLIQSGTGHEANPLLARLIRYVGLDAGILLPKVIATSLIARYLQAWPGILFALIAAYAGIVVWNYCQLREAQQ